MPIDLGRAILISLISSIVLRKRNISSKFHQNELWSVSICYIETIIC